MPDTQTLYGQSDEAAAQLKVIRRARDKAYAEIMDIAHRLVLETGCSVKDADYLLNYTHDGLRDMLADVMAQWEGERDDADEAIGNIEEADLRLSSAVVL
jgi:hypothetical protein